MILLLSLLFLSRQYGTSAAPAAVSFAEPSAYNATLFIRDDSTNASHARSVWDIAWSCLATTFAVTWVSVHPNVPFLEESSWHFLKRRIFLMCLSLLAPEVMIMWAFKQWRGAVMIKTIINEARPKSCIYLLFSFLEYEHIEIHVFYRLNEMDDDTWALFADGRLQIE